MSSLKDAAEARREKRRYQQVIREAHNKDNDAIANYNKLQEQQRSYSKEPDSEDLVKGELVETKTSPRPSFNQKVAPLTLSQETKSGEFEDDIEKQKLLRPGLLLGVLWFEVKDIQALHVTSVSRNQRRWI